MKSPKCVHYHQINTNTIAVIELPLYLVVTTIIGVIVLGSILSMMILPAYLTPTPVVTVSPQIAVINNTSTPLHYQVHVKTPDHHPITHAHVIIKNDHMISTNTTNTTGIAILTLTPNIPQGLHETYFDVLVKTSQFKPVHQKHSLKVILRS